MPATKTRPKAEGRRQTRAERRSSRGKATEPAGGLPPAFKPIAAEMRKTLVAKATAIYDRYERGEIQLDPLDANALLHVRQNLKTNHPEHLRRAMAIVQDDRYAAKSKDQSPKTKAHSPGTALAVRPASSHLPVPHLPVDVVDALTSDERRTLAKSEAEIERGLKKSLEGFVQSGRELRRIRDERLYRATHPTFEAYLADRWGLKRSSGYDLIDGAAAYDLAEPVAAKMKVRFTAPAQLRPLVGLETAADVRAIIQPAVKAIAPDKDGWRVPTMEALKDARRRDEAAPEDAEREARRQRAEGRKQRGEERGETADAEARELTGRERQFGAGMFTRGTAELPGQTHFFDDDAGQGPSAAPPSTAAGESPIDTAGSQQIGQFLAELGRSLAPESLDYWNGQKYPEAVWLHLIREVTERVYAQHLGQGNADFRHRLSRLLSSMATEIVTGKLPGVDAPHTAACELDGRVWKQMPGDVAPKAARRAK